MFPVITQVEFSEETRITMHTILLGKIVKTSTESKAKSARLNSKALSDFIKLEINIYKRNYFSEVDQVFLHQDSMMHQYDGN